KPKQSQEPIYEEIPDSPYAKLGDSNAQVKSGKSEPIYEEIPALTQENKAKRPLPELPQSGNTKANSGESDYAEIPAVVGNKAKAENAESDYAEIPALAKTGNKSDNAESSLAQANSNNNNSRVLPTMPETANVEQTGSQSAPSFFQKIKNFFKTDRTSSKKAEENANKGNQALDTEAQANGKPNYEKLEDNLNLKELLSLEAKRYDEFEQKILNNSEFLAEAREAAKKSVPEAVLKQMAGSPELDDILTDGAKRTERKINEALHFKPSEQEFNAIQQLVKKLPKSDEIMSVPEQTQRIVDALAETSKTIQRSPELKDKLKGAVEEFLNDTKNGLTVESIEKLNHGLRPDEGENRTLYKKESLTKEDAIFSGPQASKLQLAQMVEFINDAKARGVEPSVLSGMVYQRVIAYHPFAEGNGRVARVIVNKLLLDAGYPPFTKFSSKFEETIIPQSDNTKDSASSPEVINEFLRLLGEKSVDEAKPKFAPTEAVSNSAGQAEDIYAQIDPSKKKVKTESEAEKAARISKEKDETLGKKQSVPSEDNADYMTIKRLKEDMADVDQPTKANASTESPAVIENKAKAENAESDYAEIPAVVGNKAKAENAESDYAEIPAVVGNKAKAENAESDYAEIPAVAGNKAKAENAESDYAEIPALVGNKAKAENAESDYAEIPAVVGNKAKAENTESDYAEIPALAEMGNSAKVESDNTVSSLAQANSNNNNSRVLPTMPETANVEQTGAQSAPSFFQKIKNFFKTDRTSSKNAEENANKGNQALDTEAQANGKPNYEKLEDNLNLKELLSLEAKRYDEFEQKILNNSEFLAEAREAAKKSVPEAVLKQMAGSPELDDILTDGAKRTERKINEALHFKPSEQEFNAIQQLVKKLPKSDEIMRVPEQTQRIVDALAETSKTIQRSPELKDKLKGAVEEFLNDTKNGLTVESIEKLNHGLRPDEGENRTLYKKESLTKEDAIFSGPQASKLQLAQMVEFINDAKARGVEPSVLSGMVYQRVIAYHPFAEGNGRVARVIVNKLLLDAGYPPFTKFSSKFEETIIPQSDNTKDSASSPEVINEFLRLLGEKSVDEAKPKFAPTEAASNSAGQAEDIYAQIDPSKKKVKTESEAEKAARISKEKDETLGKKQSVPSEDNADYMTIKRLKEDMTKVDQPTKANASTESPAVIENKAKAENAESDYAEIPAVVGNKAKAENAESDYAEIPAVIGNKANSNNSNNNQRLAEENQIGNDVNKPKIDSKKLFEQAKQKARERDGAKEAEKKLKILAENAESLPKEHLLKALQDLAYGSSVEEATALTNKAKETRNKIHRPDTIEGFEGQNVKNMGKVMSKIELDAAYLQSRGEINQKIVDKLDSNQEFHQLMKQKLSGNEEGIKRLFGLVEQAKFEALKEVTGVEGSRAKVEFTGNNPLSMKQGSYGNDLVQMNATPILSFLRTRKQNNKEILDTIVHELTHHDQAQIIRHKDKLPEHMKPDANLMALNGVYYINSGLTNMQQYKKQPQEREAFFSGHKLGEQLSKLVDKGYTGAKREIQSIEHLPSPNSNLETLKPQSTDLGNNTLIYGLKDGRKELINRANQADKGKRNPILADSYIGELNLGYEFGNLSKLADKVKQGKVTQQDIDHIANFQDLGADNALATSSRSRINQANVEDNKKIITELLNNPAAVDSLKRIAEFNEKEQQLFQKLKQNENLDLDNPKTSSSFTKEQNEAIEQYLSAVGELNRSREDFFSEKTKLIAKETLERGGKVYFALDGLATDTTTFNKDKTQIDMSNLKKLFDPNYEFYNSVTSRELRYLYENHRDNPNLKFTIKDQVIESPFRELELK
ncbi:Fic family protein, partial [Rodentibacter pneumotropicus]|uniref:Fic family protein n=1 Tax=Rodentibacter pneumotropicus TaxID=758 RepID=UPI00232BAA2E